MIGPRILIQMSCEIHFITFHLSPVIHNTVVLVNLADVIIGYKKCPRRDINENGISSLS